MSNDGAEERDRAAAGLNAERTLLASYPISDPFAAAIRGTRMSMIVTDARVPDNPIVYANPAFCVMSGYAREEIVGRNCRMLQGTGTDPIQVSKLRAAVSSGKDAHVEILNYRKDGTEFWNSLYISPVHDENGKIVFFFGSQLNMTERRNREEDLMIANAELADAKKVLEQQIDDRGRELMQLLEQRTRLVRELDHRVKNNLQVISSLINFEIVSSSATDHHNIFAKLRRRVDAIGMVHREIYNSGAKGSFNASSFIAGLAGHILSSAKRDDIKLIVERSAAELSIAKATPLALTLNEIFSSVIHNAYGNRSGVLQLALNEQQNVLYFEVRNGRFNTGEKASTRCGTDHKLIRILARQLDAGIDWADDDDEILLRMSIALGKEDIEANAD